jgi:GT2 family glycosyltransferase/glycosyltransferase involved in cell wall biosynthesis
MDFTPVSLSVKHRMRSMFSNILTLLRRFYPRRARYFDVQYYLSTYPDVERSGHEPFLHFTQYGWREGRNPSGSFQTLFFKDKYLAKLGLDVNPAEYYMAHKFTRRLRTAPDSSEEYLALQKEVVRPYFEEFYYRARYPDVGRGVDALDHYLRIGWREGREPSATFSTSEYLKIHSHVAVLGVSPFYHYASTRNGERLRQSKELSGVRSVGGSDVKPGLDGDVAKVSRIISREFDADFYLSENFDVKEAMIDPLRHYVEFGWREGRNPNALFWTAYYLSKYADVRESKDNPFGHYIVLGRDQGRRPNPVGSVLWERPKAPSDAEWRLAFCARNGANAEVAVIMPVYKGYDDTLAAIHSVLTNPQETPFELLVINDCGPDEALNAKLRNLAETGLFSYLENEENLGFSGSINKGLAHCPNLDVILLNSDTVVFGDWIDRMRAHARRDNSIATITPMSNNATICSYPDINKNNVISLEVSPRELDQFARLANRGRNSVLPTGVGFCMYMRREVIERIGDLDAAAFPRGYGEENDYCMRALKAGFKNVFAHDVFVYHTGRISFTSFAASTFNSGQTALLRKHPDYPLRVQRYFEADPAREARMRLDLYRLAQKLTRNSVVFVTHDWAGGIETHVRNMAVRLANEKVNVLYLRVGVGGNLNVTLSPAEELNLYTPSLEPIVMTKDAELLAEFFDWLQPKMIHVHSFAGLSWLATSTLMRIIENAKGVYACTLHDFTAICHRHQLVTPEGVFCNQPEADICRTCIKSDRECVDVVDPEIRRSTYGAFLERAAHVFVPSVDTAARFKRAFPDLHLVVRPHEEFLSNAVRPEVFKPFTGPLRVAVIGAIGEPKGSGVLHDLALDARERSLAIEFTIVGYSNMAKQLNALGIKETGRYASDAEALWRLQELRPHIAFFPSIWPETHCYTLSLALSAGIPSVVFDIGAPAERLRELKTGHIFDLSLVNDPSALNDALLGLPLADLWRTRRAAKSASYPSIVEDYYGLAVTAPGPAR